MPYSAWKFLRKITKFSFWTNLNKSRLKDLNIVPSNSRGKRCYRSLYSRQVKMMCGIVILRFAYWFLFKKMFASMVCPKEDNWIHTFFDAYHQFHRLFGNNWMYPILWNEYVFVNYFVRFSLTIKNVSIKEQFYKET